MPFKDPGKARENARLNYNRRREKRIAEGWIDGRGRHGNHVRGEQHHSWNREGKSLSSFGYVLVRVPKGHHLQNKSGFAYEHQLVAEKMLGRRLQPDEEVHHKNHDKTDNRPENLEILTHSEHMSRHMAQSTLIWLKAEERKWLEEESRQTGQSCTSIVHSLISQAMSNGRKIPLPARGAEGQA